MNESLESLARNFLGFAMTFTVFLLSRKASAGIAVAADVLCKCRRVFGLTS